MSADKNRNSPNPAPPQHLSAGSQWKLPTLVTIWHLFLFFVASILLINVSTNSMPLFTDCIDETPCFTSPTRRLFYLVILCGTLGATLTASRYVVQAIRNRDYDVYRLPWQVLTPIHGGILAIVALFVVQAGFLMIEARAANSIRTLMFFGALSFLVGFAAESFVQALLRAADALFKDVRDSKVKSGND